jgi:hypothetical protein
MAPKAPIHTAASDRPPRFTSRSSTQPSRFSQAEGIQNSLTEDSASPNAQTLWMETAVTPSETRTTASSASRPKRVRRSQAERLQDRDGYII